MRPMTNDTCPTPRGHRLTPDGPRPRPCGRLACGHCGPRVALSTVKAIELTRPHAAGVVTLPALRLPPTDPARLKAFARVLGAVAADIRGDGSEWEYAWVLELSKAGIPNAHFFQIGSDVSSLRFRRALARAGGQGDLQPIRHLRILARYVLKLPLAGLDRPDVDAAAAMDLHLRLNGGFLLHASRRFWRSGDLVLAGVRAARREARSGSWGPRPSREQLAAWRAVWDLPPGLSRPGVRVDAQSEARTSSRSPGWGRSGSDA